MPMMAMEDAAVGVRGTAERSMRVRCWRLESLGGTSSVVILTTGSEAIGDAPPK